METGDILYIAGSMWLRRLKTVMVFYEGRLYPEVDVYRLVMTTNSTTTSTTHHTEGSHHHHQPMEVNTMKKALV